MEFACIHPEKQKKKKSYTNSGIVSVKSCQVNATKVPWNPLETHTCCYCSCRRKQNNKQKCQKLNVQSQHDMPEPLDTTAQVVKKNRLLLLVLVDGEVISTLTPFLFLQLVTQHSFLDYVMGGCQINFTVREELCSMQNLKRQFKSCIMCPRRLVQQ